MTITLLRPKKQPNDQWEVKIDRTEERDDTLFIFPTITHIKTKKKSFEFSLEYRKVSGELHVFSTGYMWHSETSKKLTKPEDIVMHALKKPILVSVMYHVGTTPFDQTERMNKFFECKVFNHTTSR
jgi:hypothetical protein